MPLPLVSIIIPTYNRLHMVGAAIQSAQNQTYPNKQILVIDDGSTDGTRELLATMAGIEYHYQPNQGQAAARNTGLRYSRGEFFASLDSDDIWEPTFLAASMALLQQHQLDFVFLNWNATNGSNGFMRFFALPRNQQSYCTRPQDDWWLLDAPRRAGCLLKPARPRPRPWSSGGPRSASPGTSRCRLPTTGA
jgi:glycosyltransferase involved in cell wall biosynthesis